MTAMRVTLARLLLQAARWVAPSGTEAQQQLQRVVTALGSGGAGPWRPR